LAAHQQPAAKKACMYYFERPPQHLVSVEKLDPIFARQLQMKEVLVTNALA
jgi:hypothetical protein